MPPFPTSLIPPPPPLPSYPLPPQIGLLREYWELEFAGVATPFKMDVERIVDDFVLFCMLIGNDFLPREGEGHVGGEGGPCDTLTLLHAHRL